MKIVKYETQENILIIGFKEVDNKGNNYVIYTQLYNNPSLNKQELLKQAYMQVKSTIKYEKTLEQHSLTTEEDGEEFTPDVSIATKLEVDFNNLKGIVLDQYRNVVSKDITFTIEGTDKVKIENNKVVEESVLVDTDYFIVAKYSSLIEKQKRTIFVPKIVKPQVSENDIQIAKFMLDITSKVNSLENKINQIGVN